MVRLEGRQASKDVTCQARSRGDPSKGTVSSLRTVFGNQMEETNGCDRGASRGGMMFLSDTTTARNRSGGSQIAHCMSLDLMRNKKKHVNTRERHVHDVQQR